MCQSHERAWLASLVRQTVDQAVRLANHADYLDLLKEAQALTDVAVQLAYLHSEILDGPRQPTFTTCGKHIRDSRH
jgi:hypothetical protein